MHHCLLIVVFITATFAAQLWQMPTFGAVANDTNFTSGPDGSELVELPVAVIFGQQQCNKAYVSLQYHTQYTYITQRLYNINRSMKMDL